MRFITENWQAKLATMTLALVLVSCNERVRARHHLPTIMSELRGETTTAPDPCAKEVDAALEGWHSGTLTWTDDGHDIVVAYPAHAFRFVIEGQRCITK